MKPKLMMLVIMLLASIGAVGAERGAMVRVGTLYLSPDRDSAKLGDVERGREVIVLETSRNWLHVEANMTEEKMVTGWLLDKGVVRASTPNGDKILFGEAVDSEDQGSQRRGSQRRERRSSQSDDSHPVDGQRLGRHLRLVAP